MAFDADKTVKELNTPYIDPKLLDKLKEAFPDKLPLSFDTEKVLMRMGNQEVIRFLEAKMKQQQENALGSK